MYKELVISAVIIIAIFALDFVTQKYTDNSINDTIKDLSEVREKIKEKNADSIDALNQANEKYEKWLDYHKVLAFYIEHNELEKVETDFVAGKSYIESGNYEDAISEIDKTIFILQHINEKYSINWANIF